MATEFIESMRYSEALEFLDKNLDNNPRDTISLLYKGKVLSTIGLYEEAIEIFDFIDEIAPNYTDAALYRKKLVDHLKQLRIFTRHDELNQSNPNHSAKALIYQGLANFYRQNYGEALSCYEKSLRIIPNNFFVLFYMGNAFAKLQKYGDAIANYDKALHVDVNDFNELIFKGIELDKLKRYEEAITCYKKAEKLISYDNNDFVLMLIGYALDKMKKFDDAIAYFNRILDKDPNHLAAWHGRRDAEYGKHDGPVPYYR